jgi:hypothetical protein
LAGWKIDVVERKKESAEEASEENKEEVEA